jgi:hypothetical protein
MTFREKSIFYARIFVKWCIVPPEYRKNREKMMPEYNSFTKQLYREKVHTLLRGHRDPFRLTALIFSGPKALEMPLLLDSGVHQSNIHLVDADYPNIYDAKVKYPHAVGYSMSFERAVEHMALNGTVIDMANVDLCGEFLSSAVPAAQLVALNSNVFPDTARVAFTFTNARTPNETLRGAMMMAGFHYPRQAGVEPTEQEKLEQDEAKAQGLLNVMRLHHRPKAVLLGWGTYFDTSYMMWVAMQLCDTGALT